MKIKILATICLLLFQEVSFSCSLEFQQMLLSNRQATMLQSPIGMFEEKISNWSNTFTTPKLPLDKDDGAPDYWLDRADNDANERKKIEANYLSKHQMQLVNQARVAESYEEAEKLLQHESGAFVDYTLAVLKVRFADDKLFHIDNPYNSVPKPKLGLDDEPWRLWGLYMLGKIQLNNFYYEYAIKTFEQVQNLVNSGISDPLHVAIESIGNQALAYQGLEQFDKATKNYLILHKMGHSYATLWLKNYAKELVFSLSELYRSDDSEESKKLHQARLIKAIKQPLTRRLLITYAYTHFGYDHHSIYDIIIKTADYSLEETEQLAAYAYRLGHYEDAERLAKLNQSQLSQLILAKLMIRKGEKQQALVIYSKLVSDLRDLTFEQLSTESCSIIAEQSVLALSEGNIIEAFDLLTHYTNGDYWQDIAYIAEQLLPTDTLIAKVKELQAKLHLNSNRDNDYIYGSNIYGKEVIGIQRNPVKALAYLTGRKLIRENRASEAIEFMPNQSLKIKLKNYIELKKAILNSSDDKKPDLQFKLAQWIVKKGSRILAYEGEPDWLMFDLQYINYTNDDDYEPEQKPVINWQHKEEKSILEQPKAYPQGHRFSYKYKAVEIARNAARSLEYSDPNYENYLCHAAKWLINRHPKMRREIFREFVRNAKPKKDIKYFGVKCNKVNNS